MSLKQVLIGGGTGFIGKRLTATLNKNGYNTTIISRMPGEKRITWHEIEKNGIPQGTQAGIVFVFALLIHYNLRRYSFQS
jgi:uncharacterized protein